MYEALWVCHQEFKKIEKQAYIKRIFLFTDCDEPGTEQDQEMAAQRASDLYQLDVQIELFELPFYSQMRPVFDVSKYFAQILSFNYDDINSQQRDAESNRLSDLSKRIMQKEYQKRTQGKLSFEISKGTKIALSFYTPVIKARKPGAKKVNAENNKLLQATQKLICKETGNSLYKNQIGTFYPLGGEKVLLE